MNYKQEHFYLFIYFSVTTTHSIEKLSTCFQRIIRFKWPLGAILYIFCHFMLLRWSILHFNYSISYLILSLHIHSAHDQVKSSVIWSSRWTSSSPVLMPLFLSDLPPLVSNLIPIMKTQYLWQQRGPLIWQWGLVIVLKAQSGAFGVEWRDPHVSLIGVVLISLNNFAFLSSAVVSYCSIYQNQPNRPWEAAHVAFWSLAAVSSHQTFSGFSIS